MTKVHVNLSIDKMLWTRFQKMCLDHNTNASDMTAKFMALTITKENRKKRNTGHLK